MILSDGHPTESHFTLHLNYDDPGYAVDPDDPDQRPTLLLRIHSINCGSAEYKCVFDARGQARAVILYQTDRPDGTQMDSPKEIRQSARTVSEVFADCEYMYRPVITFEPLGNASDWRSDEGLGVLRLIETDDNDITYIYIATHGNYSDYKPNGTIALMDNGKLSASIREIAGYVKEYVNGRAVLLLDCCYSGQLEDAADSLGMMDDDRYLFAWACKAKYGSTTTTSLETYLKIMPLANVLKDMSNNGIVTGDNMISFWRNLWQLYNKAVEWFITIFGKGAMIAGDILLIGPRAEEELINYVMPSMQDHTVSNWQSYLKEEIAEPFNINEPHFEGNKDIVVLCDDETYDDGFHPLVVVKDECTVTEPVPTSISLFDISTGASIPDAKVTLTDAWGHSMEVATGSNGESCDLTLTEGMIAFRSQAEGYETREDDKVVERERYFIIPMEKDRNVALYYAYLRDTLAPGFGLAPTNVSASIDRWNGRFSDSLLNRVGGLVSAVVTDMDMDGSSDLLTVTATRADYGVGYTVSLYGVNSGSGAVELRSACSNVVYVGYEYNRDGYMAVYLQRSEGKTYLFADCQFNNTEAVTLDYSIHRMLQTSSGRLTDSTVEGNSGVSLHNVEDADTLLCRMELSEYHVDQTDYTNVQALLSDVSQAAYYRPVKKDFEAYVDENVGDLARAERLLHDLEAVAGSLMPDKSETADGVNTYTYLAANSTVVTIRTRQEDGLVFEVILDDSESYTIRDYSPDTEGYMYAQAKPALTELYRAVIASRGMALSREEQADLSGFTLKPAQMTEPIPSISYYSSVTASSGRATALYEKEAFMAGEAYNGSKVTVSLPQDTPLPEETIGGALTGGIAWALVDGILDILGVGDMPDMDSPEEAPWREYNDGIDYVRISEGITAVGDWNFAGCGMKALALPDSVTRIGKSAFRECRNYEEFSSSWYSQLQVIGAEAFRGAGVTYVALPDSLAVLGEAAFKECYNLEHVEISGITDIPKEAFALCYRLSKAQLLSSIRTIGVYAFAYCGKMDGLYLSGDLARVEDYAFTHCDSLNTVSYEGTRKMRKNIRIRMGNDDLVNADWTLRNSYYSHHSSDNDAVAWLRLPESLAVIESEAFTHVSAEAVRVPSRVTRIGRNAFAGSRNLNYIHIPSSVTYIGEGAVDPDVCVGCEKDSYAWTWAQNNGCDVFNTRKEWGEIIVPPIIIDGPGGQATGD